jgi:hypothetical protein
MAIATLAEARAQLQILDTDVSQDTVIQAYLDAIDPVIEARVNKRIVQTTLTEDYDLSDPQLASTYSAGFRGTNTLWLRNRPVISLTSVTNVNNNFAWTVGNLRVRPDGRVRVMTGIGLYGYLSIVYVVGMNPVPGNYKQGELLTLQYLWESRRGVGNVQSGVMGIGEQISPDTFVLPPKALAWLDAPEWGGP